MTKQKKIIFVVLCLAILFSTARFASACSCGGRMNGENFQPCSSYWTAEAVFVGTAEKISIENGAMKVSFAVEKSIRGIGGKTIDVHTSASTASCGYPFKEGERYFVYARRGQDGRLTEHLCGSTVPLKNAADDLKYAEEIESGKSGTRIFGSVSESKRENYKTLSSFAPLAETEVAIKSKKNKFTAKTDENGFYIFKDVPSGIYRVTAKLPGGLRETVTRADLIDHFAVIDADRMRCDAESFTATAQGSVRGKISGYDGQKPPQQFVSLQPIDDGGKAVLNFSPIQPVWTDKITGEFFFPEVPAGNYLLSINPKNCPFQTTFSSPRQTNPEFGKMFFPGVESEAQAQIIAVKNFEQLQTGSFRILPPLKERWFSGTVLSADGTPLAGATVFMTVGDTKQCLVLERLAEVKTDESGRFRLKGYESYQYQIRAYAEAKNQQGKVSRLLSKIFEISSHGEVEDIKLSVDSTY